MTARKCDRCKSYYDRFSERSEVRYLKRLKPNELFIDLCPVCTQEFERWLKNEKGKEQA